MALVNKHALNKFSEYVAQKSLLVNEAKSDKDWKWKVIGVPLGNGIVRTTQPFIYLRNNYWGVMFARFYDRLLVGMIILEP